VFVWIIRWGGKRRGLIAAAALTVALAACITIGFKIPPAAKTDDLPRSITVDGVAYQRIHLVTFRTAQSGSSTVMRVPATSRPIEVRASCRLTVLHGFGGSSLDLDTVSSRPSGLFDEDAPDTKGNGYFFCSDDRNDRLADTIDPTWLPRKGDQLQISYGVTDLFGDLPADVPASWALAVYVAR
jgi:hypothetical protein